jgi:hypothetical protein
MRTQRRPAGAEFGTPSSFKVMGAAICSPDLVTWILGGEAAPGGLPSK